MAWDRRQARRGDPGPARPEPGRDPLPEILLARILAIASGYEYADDLDHLRADPVFKLACSRRTVSAVDLMSQPTISRLENTPGLRDLIRLGRVLVDLCYASYAAPTDAFTLDIDDTLDVVLGQQQLSLFNAHNDARCFLPILVYDTATSRPVAVILQPGKMPSGCEVRGHLRRRVRAIRRRWPTTAITIRGGGHYERPDAMDWCEDNGVSYIRRRHWSAQEKRAVVTEALTSGNVVGTAKRHGIQAQQIYRGREEMKAQPAPAVFRPVSLAPEPARPDPAPVLDDTRGDRDPASRPDRSPRMKIVLPAGRRIIVDESVDTEAVLRLVRGLEALR